MNEVPILAFSSPLATPNFEHRIIVGMDGLTLDGKPFPWPTAGDWVLTFSQDGIAILNVPIVVTLPPDPNR